MQKNMFKALGVFTLVFFVMSMTGAAATTCTLCKAKADTFNFNPSAHSGSVIKNDGGSGLKVVKMSKTANGGKVTMYNSKGDFYYKPASSSRTTVRDSFTYTIVNKCGQKSTAKVTINYKYSMKNSTDSQGTQEGGAVVELTRFEQINTSLKNGPVFVKIGA